MNQTRTKRSFGLWVQVFAFTALTLIGFRGVAAAEDPTVVFHGQYRINSYSDSRDKTDTFGDGNVAASRARFRPTWDVDFHNDVSLHLQLNIGHITGNTGNAGKEQGGGPAVAIRHGYIAAKLSDSVTGVAGLVPVSDKFGDTLFSGDWDFNPLTYAFLGDMGGINYRIGYAKLSEGKEMDKTGQKDDLTAYVLDVDSGGIGASIYQVASDKNFGAGELALTIFGVRYSGAIGDSKLNAFLMGSSYDNKTASVKANGFATKVEYLMPVGSANVGIMGVYSTGDKDFGNTTKTASSFITPMSLIGHHGYWGYTGKLNIQGPTDTGIDDPVNIDGGSYSNGNLGYGLMTLQIKAGFPIADKWDGYVGVGTFSSTAAPSARGNDIGNDVYAQAAWHIADHLNAEFGIDYAMLGKGHWDSAAVPTGGTSPDSARTIMTMVSRVQLEW